MSIIAVCVAAVAIVKMVLDHRERREQREDETRRQILETPLETFGESEADRLAEKYGVTSERKSDTGRSGRDFDRDEEPRRHSFKVPIININITSNSHNSTTENYSGGSRKYSRGGSRKSSKSQFAAFAWCFCAGFFGAHYFYVGKSGMGLLYLFTFGLFGFGWVVDIVRIGLGVFRDAEGRILR